PFWARAEEAGALIFLHPFGCTLDERLDQWYLSNTVGQPAENAVALSHLIFGGVLDRHPALPILAPHAGRYLPTPIAPPHPSRPPAAVPCPPPSAGPIRPGGPGPTRIAAFTSRAVT